MLPCGSQLPPSHLPIVGCHFQSATIQLLTGQNTCKKEVCSLTGAHEASERIQAPLHSNLIAMNSQKEEVKEWFYYTAGNISETEDQHGKLSPF